MIERGIKTVRAAHLELGEKVSVVFDKAGIIHERLGLNCMGKKLACVSKLLEVFRVATA